MKNSKLILTPEQELYKKEFDNVKTERDEARKVFNIVEKKFQEVQDRCKHTFYPLTEAQKKEKWFSEGAYCAICGISFYAWRCSKSPDEICHYFSCNGKVTLVNGEEVSVPQGHKVKDENEDSCIYCGMPDERK